MLLQRWIRRLRTLLGLAGGEAPEAAASKLTAEWLAYGADLLLICEGILQQANFAEADKNASDPKVVALTLMCRTANNFAAMRLLIENGFVVEARTMARCAYENLFWVGGLTGNAAEFVQRMVKADATSKLKRGAELLDWAKRQQTPSDFEGPLKAFLDDLKVKTEKGDISYKAAAGAGKIGDGYIIYRVLSTDSAHPSATSLSRHVDYDETSDPPVLTLRGMPVVEEGEVDETLEFGCSALLGVCVGANKLVGGTQAGRELPRMFERYKELGAKGRN
jgi:hypothetical protein